MNNDDEDDYHNINNHDDPAAQRQQEAENERRSEDFSRRLRIYYEQVNPENVAQVDMIVRVFGKNLKEQDSIIERLEEKYRQPFPLSELNENICDGNNNNTTTSSYTVPSSGLSAPSSFTGMKPEESPGSSHEKHLLSDRMKLIPKWLRDRNLSEEALKDCVIVGYDEGDDADVGFDCDSVE